MSPFFFWFLRLWLGIGLVLVALTAGGTRLRERNAKASVGFRLLILPSLVLLWPLLVFGLMKGRAT